MKSFMRFRAEKLLLTASFLSAAKRPDSFAIQGFGVEI